MLCVRRVEVNMMASRESAPDRSVEVCREFLRQRCDRSEKECRYAHPPSHVNVIEGRVTCCVDSIKVLYSYHRT